MDSTEGFNLVVSACKALLEHGIELGLVSDRNPDGIVSGTQQFIQAHAASRRGPIQALGPMEVSIRTVKESDFAVLARIYNHYVSTTVITFETDPITEAEMSLRVSETLAASLPWLVAEAAGCVVGYAYASKWKGRCAASMHAVIGGIALPNELSIGLHERLGFKKVAHFEQVGYKQDRWMDVGYWQLLL